MGERKQAFNRSIFDDRLNDTLPEETLGRVTEEVESTSEEFDFDSLPQKEEKKVETIKEKSKVLATKESTFPFLEEVRETVPRTFIIDKEINDILDSLVLDKKTKRRIPGRKGLLSKIMNNALTHELVRLGVLGEEVLEDLEDY